MSVSPYSQVFLSSDNYNSRKLYKKRRQQMMKELDSFCVFAGMPMDPGGEEAFSQTFTRFMQEPAFLYLTGINQAGCYLLLDPRNGDEILFVPHKDPFKEFWNGKRLGYLEDDDEVARITGIDDVRPVDELFDTIIERARKKPSCGHAYAYYFEKFPGDHNDMFRKEMLKALKGTGVKLKSAAPIHWRLRLPLEKERVLDARKAQDATDLAFREVLGKLSTLKNERELGLLLDYEMQRRSDGDLAFPTIVAGGENACCLHYVKKDEPLEKGELVLLDFGTRIGSLHSDISRTVPVNGKFNPLQKMLYEIVLDAQTEYQKFVRPGVSLKEIGMVPWDFIMDALEDRLVKGAKGKYKLLYDKRPHGVSHFIGEQIHEGSPESRSLDVVLEPGMLISCEPGLYGEFSATIGGKKYVEKIGIRIEDDLLLTKNGFENISANIPKSVKDLERLIQ
ncbi:MULTISPECIES: Xaa-Pro peptidase family protein [unclassified Fibrobacter]|uniref:M24 family metallopeptidase n=1 Tax=unclassified Fibrobacter TaxID=2634177 RepID=UPI000D6AC559|nr:MULTISPECIES: Xaa-Pro peptidase family protein [unclassified Fibrobacter]PWJ62533.1 aminopeptidase P [Fibrobacter sp. UWR4]PZW67340.1 aminopeptidase P [Fibrobacter sp. UWR1]